MIRLISVWGTGDTYLCAALYKAFCAKHARSPQEVQMVVRESHAAVVDLFPGVNYVADETVFHATWGNAHQELTYDNVIQDGNFYVHPSYRRTRTRIDQLTTRWDSSQADMYRMLLQLDPDTPLELPRIPNGREALDTIIMIEANSWPNTQPDFWPKLVQAMAAAGHYVWLNDGTVSLKELLARCAAAQWVIGPQCGLMSILVTGQFPCRKTLVTPDIAGYERAKDYWARETFPYAYVTKFANADYDVEEFKITHDNHAEVIDRILTGVNARQLWPHDPTPVGTVLMPLTIADFLDRYAVLTVKRHAFDGAARAAITREHDRYEERYKQLRLSPEVEELFRELVKLHAMAFEVLEAAVPAVLTGSGDGDHVTAIFRNRERVVLKARIDALTHAPYTDVKSYHNTR